MRRLATENREALNMLAAYDRGERGELEGLTSHGAILAAKAQG
jgi:hypothetical protein